ncbi:hypothetical protein [Petropleomorpha daqingensis]|uniref:Uncharacterized protein n=1 Tax=Petropleomorpha daqingensis TaxID=2026353 RepID=A0A853CB80_9ACTN|nr:hypothetical protein [Petropleomorpha daqingensis]NYJ04954.1 hypothetical protein [Petropleomorpha daqingensis]
MTYAAEDEETGVEVSRWGHHLPAAGLVVLAVAALIGGARYGGDAGRVGSVLLVQLAVVAGVVLATGAGLGTAVVGIAASAGALAALELPARPHLGGLLAVLGPAFLVVVLEQMLRRHRQDVVATLSVGVLLVTAVSALAVWLLVGRSTSTTGLDTTALLVVGAALLVGHVVDLVLPRPALALDVPRGLLGLVLAVAAGAAVAVLRRGVGGVGGAIPVVIFGGVLGAVAALVAVAASYVAVETEPTGRARAAGLSLVQALLPIAACAPVALALQTAL